MRSADALLLGAIALALVAALATSPRPAGAVLTGSAPAPRAPAGRDPFDDFDTGAAMPFANSFGKFWKDIIGLFDDAPDGAAAGGDRGGPPAEDALILSTDEPALIGDVQDIFARTLWGEARGEGYAGMQRVANVVMNRFRGARAGRVTWWGESVPEILRKPYQFSAWNPGDPNRDKMLSVTADDAAFAQALEIAARALAGTLPDLTGGATHYHARTVRPVWASSATRTAEAGGHIFYKGVA